MKRYLGDGVYAEYDGGQIWLKTDRRGSGDLEEHRIALDGETLRALVQFAADLREYSRKVSTYLGLDEK